jgi:hypothetical protein
MNIKKNFYFFMITLCLSHTLHSMSPEKCAPLVLALLSPKITAKQYNLQRFFYNQKKNPSKKLIQDLDRTTRTMQQAIEKHQTITLWNDPYIKELLAFAQAHQKTKNLLYRQQDRIQTLEESCEKSCTNINQITAQLSGYKKLHKAQKELLQAFEKARRTTAAHLWQQRRPETQKQLDATLKKFKQSPPHTRN